MPTIIPKATFLKTTLLSSHVATDGALVLQSGDGTRLGTLGADQVYAVTAVLNPGTSETIVANFNATGLSGDTLTGVTGDALGADVGVASGTPIQVRLTPAWLGSIQQAIHNLETVTEVSVTGAITLTSSAIGKYHRCSGTSADYPVVLPTAVGFANRTIGFRMDGALTRLVTIDGNGSQTIDGSLTRVMWAGETAVLESDGANWVKLSGRTIPMACKLRLVANQAEPGDNVQRLINWNQTDVDNTGLMADLTNHRITAARAGNYEVTVGVLANSTSAGFGSVQLIKHTGSTDVNLQYCSSVTPSSGNQTIAGSDLVPMAVGDYFYAKTSANNAYGVLGDPASNASYIRAVEVPSW